MSTKMRSSLVVALFAVTACGSGFRSPSDAFLIPNEQIATVTKEASAGDLGAVKRLIAHYEATSGNDALTEEWRAKARALGDAHELYYYAARLFTGARNESDPAKKKEMLVEALDSARRSYANGADTSTQRLIDEISRSINR